MREAFLHINTGELYVYSPDGVIDGMDTIKIQDGRFALDVPCHDEGTIMIVFPNYSQQPVFAESGGAVEIKADASHLKEMEVKGTDANELMTKFRKSLSNVSPPEETRLAGQFIKDHPESPVSIYLTRRYFVDADKPDYAKAAAFIRLMMKRTEVQRVAGETQGAGRPHTTSHTGEGSSGILGCRRERTESDERRPQRSYGRHQRVGNMELRESRCAQCPLASRDGGCRKAEDSEHLRRRE